MVTVGAPLGIGVITCPAGPRQSQIVPVASVYTLEVVYYTHQSSHWLSRCPERLQSTKQDMWVQTGP